MDVNALLDTCKLNEFVAIDLETTGLSAKEEYIIEVSAVKFVNGKENETFSFLLNPGKPIPSFIEDLNEEGSINIKQSLVRCKKEEPLTV